MSDAIPRRARSQDELDADRFREHVKSCKAIPRCSLAATSSEDRLCPDGTILRPKKNARTTDNRKAATRRLFGAPADELLE